MYIKIKRVMDFIISLILLALLSPLMLLVAIAIKATSPGSIFFMQKRITKNQKNKIGYRFFYIMKFRTMTDNAPKDTPTHLLENPELYITPIGKFLRQYSLDELPNLFSVLKGDMSLIGPRPALWNQYDLWEEREKYGANDVLPGITGWAQINGRDELPISVKAWFDGEYVRKIGIRMDCRCFFGTFVKIVQKKGIVEGKTAVSELPVITIEDTVHQEALHK